MIDAGANIGLITIPAAHALKKKGGSVIAFEPQTLLAYALGGSLALNDLDNVELKNAGLGAHAQLRQVSLPDYSQAQDFGLYQLEDGEHATAKIETVDDLQLTTLDFLKIDVEGMELDVLEGAKQTIKAHRPWCWVEYWQHDIEAIKAQFSELDYQFYKMDKLNLLCAPKSRWQDSPIQFNASQV